MNAARVLCRAALVPLALLLVALGVPVLASAQTPLSFSAIQSAINRCSSTGCTISLACGSGTETAAAANAPEIRLSNKHGVVIQGCGIDASTLNWRTQVAAGRTLWFEMFKLDTGTSSITFRDMTLAMDVTRGNGMQSCGSPVASLVYIVPGVEQVRFERVHFVATLKGTAQAEFPAGIYTYGDPNAPPNPDGVYVLSSKFETSGSGVNLFVCNDCWVEGSYFADAPTSSPANQRAYASIKKTLGEGVRITNNTFDMHPNASSSVTFSGIVLWAYGGATAGEGSQIIGNTFEGIPSDTTVRPVMLYGYNAAVISGNRFKCDPSVGSCTTWGIETEGSCTTPCNRRNVISNNVFEGFAQSGSICPLLFETHGGASTNNSDNVVVGNMFQVSSGSGICGSKASSNRVSGNHAVSAP